MKWSVETSRLENMILRHNQELVKLERRVVQVEQALLETLAERARSMTSPVKRTRSASAVQPGPKGRSKSTQREGGARP